jgi:PPOX class probable FMN-dependent enzyme
VPGGAGQRSTGWTSNDLGRTLPLDTDCIGARVVEGYFRLGTANGVSTCDTSNPALPTGTGAAPDQEVGVRPAAPPPRRDRLSQVGGRDQWSVVTTAEQLRGLVGEPVRRVADKVRDRLVDADRAFLAASPFWLVATAGPDGRCDVSPKGDPAGAVHVLDDRTLALPDRPGNRRVDGFLDVLANPHVGLLFVVPGRGDTLRVNGRAQLVQDAPFLDDLVVQGHRPRLALVVDVEEVFFHCAKAFLRARLWEPETWRPDAAPPRAAIARAVEQPDRPLAELEAYYGPAYAARLYADPPPATQ